MRNIPRLESKVDYYLVKRKPKKGKSIYHARFYDKGFDKNGNRKIKFSKSTGQTSEAAAHRVVSAWIEEGTLDIVKTNLKSYLLNFWEPDKSEYLKNKARQGKSYSREYLRSNISYIERLFLPYFKEIGVNDLTDLTPDNLESWMQHLDQREDVSGRSANRARQAVWVALNFAKKKRLISSHPGESVDKSAENLNKREAFSLAELETLFNTEWDDLRAYAAALLAFYTGARLGEIRGLRWKNVFLEDGYINILENYVDGEKNYITEDKLRDPKWNSKREGVDIPPEVVEALQTIKALCKHRITENSFVFFNFKFKNIPVGKKTLSGALERAMLKADVAVKKEKVKQEDPDGEIKEIEVVTYLKTFHCFRHSFITHFGPHMRPAELRYLVGHSNEATTERYQHRTAEGREAIKKAQRSIIPFKKAQ